MRCIKQNIAILLLGIFIYPLAFRSYHIVRHHSDGLHRYHQCCHTERTQKHSHDDTATVSNHKKKCLICEYPFSLQSTPLISVHPSVIPLTIAIFTVTALKKHDQQLLATISPRAPPALNLN